jgi:hypothetical protein
MLELKTSVILIQELIICVRSVLSYLRSRLADNGLFTVRTKLSRSTLC